MHNNVINSKPVEESDAASGSKKRQDSRLCLTATRFDISNITMMFIPAVPLIALTMQKDKDADALHRKTLAEVQDA